MALLSPWAESSNILFCFLVPLWEEVLVDRANPPPDSFSSASTNDGYSTNRPVLPYVCTARRSSTVSAPRPSTRCRTSLCSHRSSMRRGTQPELILSCCLQSFMRSCTVDTGCRLPSIARSATMPAFSFASDMLTPSSWSHSIRPNCCSRAEENSNLMLPFLFVSSSPTLGKSTLSWCPATMWMPSCTRRSRTTLWHVARSSRVRRLIVWKFG
mmetsp:Transcript_38723/g.109502  ORF Transcript_38723/g.109502 Transcript_38723/m.109502 type:complete len:213 (-) Transcript_38723:571-1209(-)